jgi:exodeoxyribonuclease VII large subunit
MESLQRRLAVTAGRLDAYSPLATLQRGYAIVTGPDGHVVTDAATLTPGTTVQALLAKGRMQARVEQIFPADGTPDSTDEKS